jgi:hypothetical protein
MKLQFPIRGKHVGGPASQQPALTSPSMNNVRPIANEEGRMRGGQRPGLKKWGTGTLIGAANQPIVAMVSVSSVI